MLQSTGTVGIHGIPRMFAGYCRIMLLNFQRQQKLPNSLLEHIFKQISYKHPLPAITLPRPSSPALIIAATADYFYKLHFQGPLGEGARPTRSTLLCWPSRRSPVRAHSRHLRHRARSELR